MSSSTDPLVPIVVPAPEPVRTGPGKKVRCEFCETELGSSGEFIRLSERAKKLRDLEDKNDEAEATIATLRKENGELRDKVQALTPPASGSGKKGLSW